MRRVILRNSGKPELRCNPSASKESLFSMDARVRPAHDGRRCRASDSGLRPPRAPRQPRRTLFSWPGFGAQQGCCCAEHATLELQCRLDPGPGHFPQDLAVPFRFRLAGPPQALLRKLAEFFGGCRHGALRAGNRRERDRSLSHRRLRDAAGDKGQDITVKTVPIAWSGCRHWSDREAHASPAGLTTQVGFPRLAHSMRPKSDKPDFGGSIILGKKFFRRGWIAGS